MTGVKLRDYWPKQTVLVAALLALSVVLVYSDWLWRWDQVIYDMNIRWGQRPAPDDVVIIAIDQASLDELGRWPWSRAIHARLIDKLSAIGTGPIGLDVIFAEPAADDAEGDAALARAVANNAQVILPVIDEQLRPNGQLLELLPFPELAAAAAGFGHGDIELDRDGIARGVFLQAGLETAHWPTFALALLQLHAGAAGATASAAPAGVPPAVSSMKWVRERNIRIAFAGPPGHFARTSYVDVLHGRVPPETLAGKVILIGYTASGLDALPTPLSALDQPMPGIEIHANILDTLRRDIGISMLDQPWRILLTAVLVLWPVLLYMWLPPRWVIVITLAGFILPVLGSSLLLRAACLWYPPFVAMLLVILAYMLWSYLRLQAALRYFNQELRRLNAEPTLQSALDIPRFATVMEFLRYILPVQGCVLLNAAGAIEQQWGQAPAPITERPASGRWTGYGSDYWMALPAPSGHWYLGVRWSDNEKPKESQLTLLDQLVTPYMRTLRRSPRTPVELLELRIDQVQRATGRLRDMRAFINNSVGQMASGVIVTDNVGRILLANPQAAFYLQGYANRVLTGELLTDSLTRLEFSDAGSWQQNLKTVLLDHRSVQLVARTADGRDLQIDIAPFSDIQYISCIVVNFTDIS
jgi:CHASE2 domain-containing sensor protein